MLYLLMALILHSQPFIFERQCMGILRKTKFLTSEQT